ncbi:MAG: hypothetical protein NVS2B4_17710 [Ramlibacter sp.]
MRFWPGAIAWTLAVSTCARDSGSQEVDAPERPFKFTLGAHALSGGDQPSDQATDANLRHTSELGNAWIGWYGERVFGFSQRRTGWDRGFSAGAWRVQPSVQLACGGFRGGSLAVETGHEWVIGAGLGRTNLRPYANLNFDPNDSITLQAGRRWADGDALALLLLADNREHPDQRHLHLNRRAGRPGHTRLTLDLLAQRGTLDDRQRIRRLGASVTYDWPRCPSPQDMLRLSAGARF